jgi:hypothetical protein
MGMTPKDLVPVPRWKEELAILGFVLLVLVFLVAYGIAWSPDRLALRGGGQGRGRAGPEQLRHPDRLPAHLPGRPGGPDWKRDAEAAGRVVMPELTVCLNGDFLTGTLHGLEKHSDAPNIVRAALACGDLIALALRDLAADFPAVSVVGVSGNHGRLPDDRKVPTKDPTRSWDYLAYEVARAGWTTCGTSPGTCPTPTACCSESAGTSATQAHGNFIPNNLGVVGYGVRRFTSSLASNLRRPASRCGTPSSATGTRPTAAEFAGIEAFICPS